MKKPCELFELKDGSLIDPSKVISMRISEPELGIGHQAWYQLPDGNTIAIEHFSKNEASEEIAKVNLERKYYIDPAKKERDRIMRTAT